MSRGAAVTEYTTIEKLFSWKINNFDLITTENLQQILYKCKSLTMLGEKMTMKDHYYLLKSSSMTALHPFTGEKCTATLSLKYCSFPGKAEILLDCSPVFDKTYFSYQINDETEEFKDSIERPDDDDNDDDDRDEDELVVKKLTIFVHAVIKKDEAYEFTPFKAVASMEIMNRLKNMWDNDSRTHFVIKCKDKDIKVIKPFLAAASPVFNRMFETEMNEKSKNFVEITEFKPEIVEKMVEFCEFEDIKEWKDFEEDLFKIAHKYQMDDLTKFAVEKMAETASISNIESRLQIANLYELKEFKKWCMNFIFRNNLEIEF